ncbi:MarR family winged helix-turn-helix transcriptional regulator [Oceanobacillus jeddahense]|uniref:MarR family transcriptional regulator n=1 Tax=Oceanobacillus jeddahense TaxID=1462527 RepID=A0ABY5JW50_9BACI|nr:MarR family transcriptional regulator [Oceanobacillus jeddahense]UUI04379.1 MarR family transcriptional regulator [Oceanobacillus jeddahense]
MIDNYLNECLYFTTSRLNRLITKMAEDTFSKIGLSPNAAFFMMILSEKDGVTQKEMGESLHLQPSTVTRLIEGLIKKMVIEKEMKGRSAHLHLTDKGQKMIDDIYQTWDELREIYNDILGKDFADQLSKDILQTSDQLEKRISS